MKNKDLLKTILGFASGLTALALLFVSWVYPEIPTATYVFGILLVLCLGGLAYLNQRALKEAAKTRSMRYGANALMTVALVFAILIVVNFLNYNHFWRKDLTKSKKHSLSDQTMKVIGDLKQDLKLTVFTKTAERDAAKSVIDNYLYNTKKIHVEYIDPDRDPVRTKAANVKKYGTVIISSGTRDTRIDEVNEEKLTNGILKVLKDKAVTVCFLTGHGEKPLDAAEAASYSQVKAELTAQNYESKSVSLVQEGKVPAECTVVAVMGPTKAFFDKELTVLRDWILEGGRAVIALDPNLKGGADYNKDLKDLLSENFYIDIKTNLVLDPTSRLMKVSEAVPVVGIYSKDHSITRDFQNASFFPLTSTIELKANPPSSLKTWWLAKSTPKAFATTEFKAIAAGKPITLDAKKDQPGPHVLMVAAEGSAKADKKPARAPRVIAFGTSQLAMNQWARYAANSDLFLNAVSWLADDENLISIRPKDEGGELPALGQTEANYIQLVTMILVPGGVLLLGLVLWIRRRRL